MKWKACEFPRSVQILCKHDYTRRRERGGIFAAVAFILAGARPPKPPRHTHRPTSRSEVKGDCHVVTHLRSYYQPPCSVCFCVTVCFSASLNSCLSMAVSCFLCILLFMCVFVNGCLCHVFLLLQGLPCPQRGPVIMPRPQHPQ